MAEKVNVDDISVTDTSGKKLITGHRYSVDGGKEYKFHGASKDEKGVFLIFGNPNAAGGSIIRFDLDEDMKSSNKFEDIGGINDYIFFKGGRRHRSRKSRSRKSRSRKSRSRRH